MSRNVFQTGFWIVSRLCPQQHGFGVSPGIVNVAALMQAIQNISTVAFPRSEPEFVLERGQIQAILFLPIFAK
jgi:hypothetical protein